MAVNQVHLLTQTEYAKRRGCSKVAVHKAIKAGRISLVDGKIDPDAADRDWHAKSLPRVGSSLPARPPALLPAPEPPPADDPIDVRGAPVYQEERARRERAMADQAEMEVGKMTGELLEATGLRASLARQIIAIRDGLLQMPGRLAPVLAAETDIAKVRQALDLELRNVLAQFVGLKA